MKIESRKISLKIEPITSTLLILQSKNWIDQSKFDKFSNIFSCKSENDILAEIFFLISNFIHHKKILICLIFI